MGTCALLCGKDTAEVHEREHKYTTPSVEVLIEKEIKNSLENTSGATSAINKVIEEKRKEGTEGQLRNQKKNKDDNQNREEEPQKSKFTAETLKISCQESTSPSSITSSNRKAKREDTRSNVECIEGKRERIDKTNDRRMAREVKSNEIHHIKKYIVKRERSQESHNRAYKRHQKQKNKKVFEQTSIMDEIIESQPQDQKHRDQHYVGPSLSKNPDYLFSHLIPQGNFVPYSQQDKKKVLQTLQFQNPTELKQQIRDINGSIYQGCWCKGKKEGQGRLQFNGGKYEGDFKDNKFHGKGKFTFDNQDQFTCSFVSNMAEGKGIFWFRDGSIFWGLFKANKPDGWGKMTWKDGSGYQGYWKEGEKHGKGKLLFTQSSFYIGEFKGDEWDGEGQYRQGEISFVGTWSHNKKVQGTFKNTQYTYEGSFVDNKKQGKGRMEMRNGQVFEGYWKRGKMHGTIIQKDAQGVEKQWHYVNGKRLEEIEI